MLALRLLVLLPLLWCTGCTKYLWRAANNPRISDPYVVASPNDPSRVIAVYSPEEFWGVGRRTYIELPNDSDGQVKRPFRFEVARDPATSAYKTLPRQQQEDVAAYRFDAESIIRPPRDLPPPKPDTIGGSAVEPWAVVLAVNDPRRRPLTRRIDSTLVVVPSSQPRPAAEHAAAKTQAVLLTPVTVAVDVVLSPWYLIVYAAYGFGG